MTFQQDQQAVAAQLHANNSNAQHQHQQIEAGAPGAEVVDVDNDVIVLNAPEPSRTKNLADTKLPPEATEHVCLECGESLATDNHK